MPSVATASIATLSGHVAMLRNVSGVTIAPSSMPISTKHMRATVDGTRIGRPASAAMATASTEPETSPAGMCEKRERDAAGSRGQQRLGGLQDHGARGAGRRHRRGFDARARNTQGTRVPPFSAIGAINAVRAPCRHGVK